MKNDFFFFSTANLELEWLIRVPVK